MPLIPALRRESREALLSSKPASSTELRSRMYRTIQRNSKKKKKEKEREKKNLFKRQNISRHALLAAHETSDIG
jgi:uncharacterized LabA/DUF88 family protein